MSLSNHPVQEYNWAELFKAGLRQPRVGARFGFRFESLKSVSVLNLFVYKLKIGSSKINSERKLSEKIL